MGAETTENSPTHSPLYDEEIWNWRERIQIVSKGKSHHAIDVLPIMNETLPLSNETRQFLKIRNDIGVGKRQ